VVGRGEAVPAAGGAEAGLAGGVAAAGLMVSVRVARFCAAGSVGMNKGPFWPQAASNTTTLAARASRRSGALTRIWQTFNMVKL
jgi:hypothetical protein